MRYARTILHIVGCMPSFYAHDAQVTSADALRLSHWLLDAGARLTWNLLRTQNEVMPSKAQ